MTNFEKSVDEMVSEYLKGKDISKLGTVLEFNEWVIKFVKHLSQIRPVRQCVDTVMDSVKRNTGEYWKDWVKTVFVS